MKNDLRPVAIENPLDLRPILDIRQNGGDSRVG
jgi:hypothetical protein